MSVPATKDPNRYLTLVEVAGLLRCSKRSVQRYIEDGKLPYLRLGKRYLFRLDEICAMTRRLASVEDILK